MRAPRIPIKEIPPYDPFAICVLCVHTLDFHDIGGCRSIHCKCDLDNAEARWCWIDNWKREQRMKVE